MPKQRKSGIFSEPPSPRHLKLYFGDPHLVLPPILHVGSVKIEKNCTCTIKLTKYSEKEWVSETCETHYGHSMDLEHLGKTWLPDGIKQEFAAKMQMGVTKEAILDQIRSESLLNFERRHVLNRQDLANIERSFGLDIIQRHFRTLSPSCQWSSRQTGTHACMYAK